MYGESRICYHGTSAENAANIEQTGFKPGTWFAAHLEDALGYGGSHIFEVAFDNPPLGWQFTTRNTVSPERIVSHCVYTVQTLNRNDALRRQIFEAALSEVTP